MNIQRKYSLPNCTLLLEGLSDATRVTHFQELRPELSILVNAECYISGSRQPLVGGREFLESLVRVVSAYAQEFFSHVPHPQAHDLETEIVQLHKMDKNLHRLVVHSEESKSNGRSPIQIDLNTVQLFDLVEAVDQFFADSQTLPEISLKLQSVPRRYGNTSQALVKQAVPASVGATSLAAAAIAFGFLPVPEAPSPEVRTQSKVESQTNNSSINSTVSTAVTPTPTPNEQIAATPELTPSNTFTPVPNSTSAVNSTTTAVRDIEELLSTVSEITDPSQLRALNRQVYNQINPSWNDRSGLRQDLVYRVGVAADGAIVGYKAVDSGSNEAVEKTPLASLLYNPAQRGPVTNEPIAQFKVVFTREGVLQVSPWRGYSRTPDVVGEKITDPTIVKELSQKLYNSIDQNQNGTPSYTRDLKYRVAVNNNGIIADYEPLNQPAFDYFRETPLPKIFQTIYGSNVAAPNNKEPLAHFQVVFKPNGELEVSPWEGYR